MISKKIESFLNFNNGYLFKSVMERLTDPKVFKKAINSGVIKIDFDSLKFFLHEIGFMFYDRDPVILNEEMIMYPAYSRLLFDTYLFKIKLPATKMEIESEFIKRNLIFPPKGLVEILERIPDERLYNKRFLEIGEYSTGGQFYSLANFSENGSGSNVNKFDGLITVQDGYSNKDTWAVGVKET